MKKSLYKIGAAVFVAVFIAASFGFSTQAAEKKMTQIKPPETIDITFTFDRASGRLLSPHPSIIELVRRVSPRTMQQIYEGDGFRYVVTFTHSHQSPGCIYWYDYVAGWLQYCWEQP